MLSTPERKWPTVGLVAMVFALVIAGLCTNLVVPVADNASTWFSLMAIYVFMAVVAIIGLVTLRAENKRCRRAEKYFWVLSKLDTVLAPLHRAIHTGELPFPEWKQQYFDRHGGADKIVTGLLRDYAIPGMIDERTDDEAFQEIRKAISDLHL